MSDYHCPECQERNELADKLGEEAPKWLRQHPSHHAVDTTEQLQFDLFNDRRS